VLICGLFVDSGLCGVVLSPESNQVNFVSGRIVGGRNANVGEFPYQVTLQWNFFWNFPWGAPQHMCGGAIVNRYYIISAAHCITTAPPFGRMEIFAGRNNIAQPDSHELSVLQKTTIERQWLHPNYTGGIEPHDIAVFRVTTPFVFTEYVQPIKLPPTGYLASGIGTVTGWGSISYTENPITPAILQVAELPIVEWNQCKNLLNSIGVTALGPTNLCTGPLSGGLSICSGDSGGPFVQRNADGELVLIGIVSWGFVPCGFPNRPQVFAYVPDYIDWVNRYITWE
jgi:secreted trypsin-like serine protease